jgi:hypothetical protein
METPGIGPEKRLGLGLMEHLGRALEQDQGQLGRLDRSGELGKADDPHTR